jgi:hypothetical protein
MLRSASFSSRAAMAGPRVCSSEKGSCSKIIPWTLSGASVWDSAPLRAIHKAVPAEEGSIRAHDPLDWLAGYATHVGNVPKILSAGDPPSGFHKWAFSEAAALFLRNHPAGHKRLARMEKKHGKGKALIILARRRARAVYDMLQHSTTFDIKKILRG